MLIVPFTQFDVDGFCGSPLPALHFFSPRHCPSQWHVGNGGCELIYHSSGSLISLPVYAPRFLLLQSASFPQCRSGGTPAGNSIDNFSPLQGVPPNLHCESKYPKITVSF